MRISDWSSDVCSSDLVHRNRGQVRRRPIRQDLGRSENTGRNGLSKQHEEGCVMSQGVREQRIGNTILDMKNISLAFGGVKALTDISFDVKEHEIRAIIGPNGAGKSSMLNVINGVYTPQNGEIILAGVKFSKMNSRRAAEMGIERPFQTRALVKGMRGSTKQK